MPMKLPIFASPMRARATDPAQQEREQRQVAAKPADPTTEILSGRAPARRAAPAPTALGNSRSLQSAPRIAGPGSGWYRRGELV